MRKILKNMNKTKLLSIGFMLFTISLSLIQIIYLFIGKSHQFEYIYDELFYIFNSLIILSFGISTVLYTKYKGLHYTKKVSFIFGVLTMVTFIGSYLFAPKTDTVVSFSKNHKNKFVVKIDKETGVATYYRDFKGYIFVRANEQFQYAVKNKIKMQWLTSDICTLTYLDPDFETRHFVATFGSRSDIHSYKYVKPALRGEWIQNGEKEGIKKISVDDLITIDTNDNIEEFSAENIKQFGTTSLVLYRMGSPIWTIALKEGDWIEDNLINADAKIILSKVSNESTVPITFHLLDNSKNPKLSKPNEEDEKQTVKPSNNSFKYLTKSYNGKSAVKNRLVDAVKETPDLSKFKTGSGFYAVQTDSTDMVEITRKLFLSMIKWAAKQGYSQDMQMTEMKVIAGMSKEFYVEFKYSGVIGNPIQGEENSFISHFRIKKANGGYLAYEVGQDPNRTYGLKLLNTPVKINTSNDTKYKIFVPAFITNGIVLTENELEEKSNIFVNRLQDELKKSSTLTNFQNEQDFAVKITSNSTDIFEIAKLALVEYDTLFPFSTNLNYDNQIQKVTILAGDMNDFLVNVIVESKISDPASDPSNSNSKETMWPQTLFRIKKGDGVFLAGKVPAAINGAVGLLELERPETKEFSFDPKFHYSLKGKPIQ